MAQKVQIQGLKTDGTLGTVKITDNGYIYIDITDTTIVAEFTPGSVVNVDAYTPTGAFQPATEVTLGEIKTNQTNGDQKTEVTSLPDLEIDLTPETIAGGVKTVTTAGTGEALVATSTPAQYVIISALSANTGIVYVGGADVDKTTKNGIPLTVPSDASGIKAPAQIIIPINDAAKIYIDTTVDNEGVNFVVVA